MPSRYATRRALANGVESIEPNQQLDAERNMFDKAFKDEIGGWENWMQWEGDSGVAPGMLDRQVSQSSSTSSTKQWPVDVAVSPSCTISPAFNTPYTFEDAPFEFDDGVLEVQPLGTSNPPPQPFRWPIRGASSLSATEERTLQAIAMPRHAVSRYKEESTPSVDSSPTFSPALPAPRHDGRARKRQKSTGDEEASNTCQSRRRGHNAIEKRYRTNLNDKIVCLRDAIPSLRRDSASSERSDDEDSDGDSTAKQAQQKYGKADILVRALDYIKHLEMTTGRMGGELDVLNTRIEAFEQLAMNGIIGNNGCSDHRKLSMRSETLESIQEDFKQISTKDKSELRVPAPRRKSSRQKKG